MGSHNILFKGSIVALVTPMHEDGSIDEAAFERLIEWHISAGTHGIVVMGTTGECSLVSDDEHCRVVELAVELAQKRIPIIAGCGSASTQKVVDLVKRINPFGVDGFLCVTPYYVKPTQGGMLAHFNAVADACQAPLILYNVPGRTACDLKNDTVVELAKHANIVAIKDATGDISRVEQLISLLGSDFGYLSGDDATAYEFMRVGGHGMISVTANVAPQECSRWCELMLSKAPEAELQAKEIFERLAALNDALFIEANPIPVKWALAYMQKITDKLRLPLVSPQQSTKNKIIQALENSAVSWSLE